jgi:aspartate/methionine/tyrosine aminotransferase
MAVIADEVFLDFAFGSQGGLSCAANSDALTFTLSGVSKICGLPQMKMAWVIASGPEELKQQALERMEVIADTYLSPNAPVQLATPVFLQQRHGFQKQLVTRARRNLAELDQQLAGQKACTRLELEGGWYAVLRVPAVQPDEELAITLLETKSVYVHPGHFFDFAGNGYLVMSLITLEEEFAEGIRRVLSAF